MKRQLLMCGLGVGLAVTQFGFAEEALKVTLGKDGEMKIVSETREGTTMSLDRVIWKPGTPAASETVVFESEGRKIVTIDSGDMDGDSSPEILVSMDPGGSGGFVEFALLKKNDTGWSQIWGDDNAFKGGQGTFADVTGDGNPEIRISQKNETGEPAADAVYMLKDGVISAVASGTIPK